MHRLLVAVGLASFLAFLGAAQPIAAQGSPSSVSACQALTGLRNLTIISAQVRKTEAGNVLYCYVRGILPPAISFHVQLPLPENWNGRFVNWGDGGSDGDLDFADHRVAEGYAVANSNTGHDNGAEPGTSYAYNNRQAEIDFGYRAVRLTVSAAKRVIEQYYGRAPTYSYHEGCSTGGRQGLMEAQRFPGDFDGIVAGAPVNHLQALAASGIWLAQRLFADNFAGNLAYDTNGDGSLDSLTKLSMLQDAVLKMCDKNDGIADGIIDPT